MTGTTDRSAGSGLRDARLVDDATAWFVRMSSDLVSEEDRRAFRAWLDRDPAHGAAYAEVQALWDELGQIPDTQLGRRRQSDAPRRGGTRAVRVSPRRRLPHAVAAACLLGATALGLWSLGGADGLTADYTTSVGETREVALADGSVAHLNTDTALAVDFTGVCRCVELLHGEAFFRVAPDAERPFRVTAGSGTSQALGTAFNVHETGAAVSVAVAEGEVRVYRDVARTGDGAGVTLRGGEMARYRAEGEIEKRQVDLAALTGWRQGRLIFVDRRLREVVAELDRYRPGAIVFLDSAIADARFSGVFHLADTDAALAAIETTLPVDAVRLTPWLTLLRARN